MCNFESYSNRKTIICSTWTKCNQKKREREKKKQKMFIRLSFLKKNLNDFWCLHNNRMYWLNYKHSSILPSNHSLDVVCEIFHWCVVQWPPLLFHTCIVLCNATMIRKKHYSKRSIVVNNVIKWRLARVCVCVCVWRIFLLSLSTDATYL